MTEQQLDLCREVFLKRREVCYSCVESQCGGFVCYSCVKSVVDLYATLDLCRICGGFCSCLFFLPFVAVVSAMVTLFCLSR